MISIRKLTPNDAAAVSRIESRFHKASLVDTPDVHRQRLIDALEEGISLSFGAFAEHRLVGYLLCYGIEPAAMKGNKANAIYIEDVTMEPEHRKSLARLIGQFGQTVSTHFPDTPIEAHVVEDVLAICQKHDILASRLGFRWRGSTATGESIGGKPRYVVRWDPLCGGAANKPTFEKKPNLEHLPGHTLDESGQTFELKLVQHERDWDALEPFWDSLLLALGDHTVFQSYRYQRLWWKHFGADSELAIVVILKDRQVVGIAPFRTCVDRDFFGRYRRKLTFIGSRWEVDRPRLLIPDDSPSLLRAFAQFVVRHLKDWDVGSFYEQLTDSPILTELARAFRDEGLLVGTAKDSECPYLELAGSWEAFIGNKSPRHRKNLRASFRRLREIGELQYEMYDALPDVLSALDEYRAIEELSWKQETDAGVLTKDYYYDFYRDVAEAFAPHNEFVVRVISAAKQRVAATFGLVHEGVYYSLQIAHDKTFDRCSPGTYLESLEIEDCFRAGFREYDFLGGFLNNKSRWTTSFRRTSKLDVYRRRPLLIALYVLKFLVKPLVDRVRLMRRPREQ